MLKLVLLSALTVSAVLVLGSFDQSDALSPMQRHMIDLADSSSDLAVKVKFGCWRVEGLPTIPKITSLLVRLISTRRGSR